MLQPAQRLLLLLGLLAESAFLRAQRRQPFRQGVALFIVQQLDAAGALVQRIQSVLACLWDSNTCSDSRP